MHFFSCCHKNEERNWEYYPFENIENQKQEAEQQRKYPLYTSAKREEAFNYLCESVFDEAIKQGLLTEEELKGSEDNEVGSLKEFIIESFIYLDWFYTKQFQYENALCDSYDRNSCANHIQNDQFNKIVVKYENALYDSYYRNSRTNRILGASKIACDTSACAFLWLQPGSASLWLGGCCLCTFCAIISIPLYSRNSTFLDPHDNAADDCNAPLCNSIRNQQISESVEKLVAALDEINKPNTTKNIKRAPKRNSKDKEEEAEDHQPPQQATEMTVPSTTPS